MSDFDWISSLYELKAQGLPFCLATIVDCGGATPRDTGTRMIVLPDRTFLGTIGGGNLENKILQEAQDLLLASKNSSKRLSIPLGAKAQQCCGGVVEILLETFNQAPMLYIFGAGHVGQTLARTLEGTALQLCVWDTRDEWINSSLLPIKARRNNRPFKELLSHIQNEEDHFAVVMTHSHDLDLEIVAALAEKKFRYLGLIGSSSKWMKFKKRLGALGLTPENIEKIECPMGLATGGKLPQEIAISVSARILSIFYGK